MTVADEAWVTCAVDDESGIKALVLLKSLRRVLTSRKVVVIISDGVSAKIRNVLEDHFDSVFQMNRSSAIGKQEATMQARIYSWNLPIFRKCVFLDFNCFVLKNCDDIFTTTTDDFYAQMTSDGQLETSVFLFTPAPRIFRTLTNMMEKTGKDFNVILAQHFAKMNDKICNKIYANKIFLKHGTLTKNENEMNIVIFEDIHPIETTNSESNGLQMAILEKSICDLWKNIYLKNVKPTLNLLDGLISDPKDDANIKSGARLFGEEFTDAPHEPIAIVGMSCRYPAANNLSEFWDMMITKSDGIRLVTPDRWTKEQGCKMTAESKTTQAGFLNCPVDSFDGKFFGISPMELSYLDPQQRLLLEVIWESLENGGINPHSLQNTYTGVYTGTWTNDYKELLREQGNKEFYRAYMGNSPGSAAGRISFILGLTGPSVATESGCSSGMIAVDLACKSLRLGETRLAIAAGCNLLLHPFTTSDMSMVCAPDGHCKTFDVKADGFGRAEGCGSLLLKRLSDAVMDGDRIHGLIRGCGISQEGPSRSMGTPTIQCEALAMQLALKNSGVKPSQIQFVETHGTGTPVGDPMEVAAIAQVYGEEREEKLIIGSVKTNVGHTESCSGITGIMKVILSLQNEMIPPHRNFETLNPHINLEAIPAEIPLEATPWKKKNDQPRFAGVSSFGITGTDAHVVIQEAPSIPQPTLDLKMMRPQNILALSAKNDAALDDLLKSYEQYLSTNCESVGLADVAFTANTGRAHFQHRVAVIGRNTEEIVKKLRSNGFLRQQIPDNKPKLCFLFTGQGSQYPGMGKILYETSPVFRMNFDKCDKILREKYSVDIKAALWNEDNDEINRTIYSQTSIFCIEYCLTKLWESYGVKPECVIGHSLGEFAAAVACGILELEDAMELVAERSRLIDSLPNGKMIAIKSTSRNVEIMLERFSKLHPDKPIDFAALNASDQIVLAGSEEAVKTLKELCLNNNIKTHVLSSTHAFHSAMMDPILPELREIASKITHGKPNCTYISGMDGKVLEDNEMNSEYWVRHTRESVKFFQASTVSYNEGCRMFLEIGPNPVLSALTMMNCGDFGEPMNCLPSLRKKEDEWETLLGSLGKLYTNGFNIDWKQFDQYFPRRKISLPLYPFQRKPYWFDTNASLGGVINGVEIHPLIGCPIPNATAVKLYQSSLDLKKSPYIKDHCIGSKIIFPAAGYMEMVLAAGHANTQSSTESLPTPGTLLSVENLLIEAPLCLYENEACDIQILVSSEDMTSAGSKVSINRRVNAVDDNTNIKWLRHAHAEFYAFAVDETVEDFSVANSRCSKSVEMADFYEQLSKIGLNFGNSFRSLKAIQRGECKNELIGEIHVPENANEFLCHPIIIDAMIQALMLSRNEVVENLIVPVTIKKFIWLSKCEDAQKLFVHCRPETDNSGTGIRAILYNDEGKKLAVMIGAELIETSIDVIFSALEQQKISLSNLYEEVWRPTPGPLYGRVAFSDCDDVKSLIETNVEGDSIVYSDGWNEIEERIVSLGDRLTYLYILQGFYDLGWKPAVGETIELKSFTSNLQILDSQEKLVRHFLCSIFVEEGILSIIADEEWNILRMPPQPKEISSEISNILAEIGIHQKRDFQLIVEVGSNFAKIISGKESALSILFPEDPTKISADVFYTESNVSRVVNEMSRDILKTILEKIKSSDGKEIIRFLEVGGGTGSSTKALLPIIDESKLKYEYTFTDISQMFFNKAEKEFEAYAKNIKYKILNVEEDPKSQGAFIPHYYDIIIASNVMHATQDLAVSVKNLRHLLRNSGLVLLVETNKPLRHVDLIFGVLEGYWRFNDFDIRRDHTVISGKQWEDVFKSCGFTSTSAMTCYGEQQTVVVAGANDSTPVYLPPIASVDKSNTWILLSDDNTTMMTTFFQDKFEKAGNNVVIVTPSNEFQKITPQRFQVCRENKSDLEMLFTTICNEQGNIQGVLYLWGLHGEAQNNISLPFLNLAQIFLANNLKFKVFPRIVVVTSGIMPVNDQGPTNPSSATLWGLSRSLRSEQPNLTCRCIDALFDEVSTDQLEEIFMEIFNEDGENQVAYRDNRRYCVRFVATKLSSSPLTIPNTNRFALTLPASKTFADLKFDVKQKFQLQGTEVELLVKAAGLNFRDVFNVLKPDAQFENSNSVGADFAGIITDVGPDCQKYKIGDCVIGCNFDGGALPSHVKSVEDAVVPLPARFTFAEGATLPAVFATAYYCLVTIGRLQKGETILIHTASGGVGICAIQLAKHIGAEIIATAGNKRKRAYLRTLGVDHIFHSRNLSFGDEINRVTNGRGVDMVLNSLTGPGFKETSLKSCSKTNARFIEMSKLNIWTNEEVLELRTDVEYTVVDLTSVSKETWKMLFGHLNEFLEFIKPIPYTRFDGVQIREALLYLQKAKHIGKVMCIMPDMVFQNGEFIAKSKMFNDRSTYIITGGLGGIGIEVAKWMTNAGAEHVVLVGRQKPGETAERTIKELQNQGKNIVVENFDVGDFEQCKTLITKLSNKDSNLPQIRGIFHAAGCLADAIIVNQSWDKFEKTFNAKVKGGFNLHTLTLEFPLEHFVMFSSVVALFGPLGQSNHAAANSYLDSLAHYRISQGLPATTINWGQWGQVGVAAGMEVPGLVPFSPTQGIAALEAIISKTRGSQVAVLEADFGAIRRLFPQTKRYVEELKLSVDPGVQVKISSEKFWKEYDSAEEDDKMKIVQGYIENILRQILKLDKSDPIDENQNLHDMGLDSLMMVEMKNFLQILMGNRVTVSTNSLQDCHNLVDLTNRLVDLIEGSGDKEEIIPLTKEELNQLIQEDATLPEHIKPSPDNKHCKPSDVRTILITGATGNLAPYILQEVSNLQQIEKIYCLIRPNRRSTAVNRLQNALKDKNLLKSTKFEKIECVEGDLGDKSFGMIEYGYQKLTEEVDAILHCAVKSNHIEEYRKSEKNKRDIRTINVGGTLRILEFAVTGKTKLVLHSSSMIAMTKADSKGQLPERYPNEEDFNNLPNVGYGISKFICDRLMHQASENGVPVKCLRFPGIAGSSQTGQHTMADNHLMLRMISYLKMGMMPSLPLPFQLLPVDVCAEIAVKLFFDDNVPHELFNVTNPNCPLEQDFTIVGDELGHSIKVVDYQRFIEKLEEEGENSLLYPLKDLYFNEDTFMALSSSPDLIQAFMLHTALKRKEDFFRSKKLQRFIPEIVERMEMPTDIIKRDLLYAKNAGIFKKFGMES